METKRPRPYANPYIAGTCLGLVLLASYVVAGRGLGASGAFAASGTSVVNAIAPATAAANPYFSRYLNDAGEARPWTDWLFVELLGVLAGGFASSLFARRWHVGVDRGAGMSVPARLLAAAGGGFAMGAGAVLARGCTSGQALTGGALLSVGSWIFITAAFGSAYAFAWPLRRLWR